MKLITYKHSDPFLSDWESFFANPSSLFEPFFASGKTSALQSSTLSGVQWFEDSDAYYARVEVPGVSKDALAVDVEEGLVRLSGERVGLRDKDEVEPTRFEKVLRSPDGIETAGIEATLEDGILEMMFPKAADSKPVSIKIK